LVADCVAAKSCRRFGVGNALFEAAAIRVAWGQSRSLCRRSDLRGFAASRQLRDGWSSREAMMQQGVKLFV
jgi:hypothetical protein